VQTWATLPERKPIMAIQTLGLSSSGSSEVRSNPLNNPAVPLGSNFGWQWLLGNRQSDANEIVSPASASATATVNACLKLLSQSVAAMTPLLYLRSGRGKSEAESNPMYRLLALEPNPYSTTFTIWESFMISLCLWGNGFIEIQRDGSGTAQGLWFLQPDKMSLFWQDGVLQYRTTQGLTAGFRTIAAENVVHVPWASHDGLMGVSPVQEVRNTLGGNIAMEKFGARFFANYAMPQMALLSKQVIKPEDRQKMRSDWEQLQSGHNQHRVAILDQELDLKILSLSNEDAQFLESRRFSREEICGLYGLKPSQIGSESRVAGETFSGQQLSFLTDCLNPWLARIRQELTRKLLKGLPQYEIRHDVSDRLRLDVESQLKAFSVAMQWGIMTANECRKELGMDPGGSECDVYLTPGNMMNANRLLVAPTPTTISGVEDV
jgi:HK97 family phage portal protein